MTSKYIETYKCISKFGDIKSASISRVSSEAGKPEVCIKGTWSYRNIATKLRTLVTSDYVFDGSSVKALLPTPNNSDVILSSIHESGSSAYMFNEKEKTYLLLTSETGKSSILNIDELELHGMVYRDEKLASFGWSKDGSRVAYVAEKKRPKEKSFFTIESKEQSEKSDAIGEENRYIDDWGEQMEGQHVGTIAIVNVKDMSIKVMDVPEDFLVGEVCWSADGNKLFGVAYTKTAFRLGLIYCPIRENILFEIDLEGNFKQLGVTDGSKYSINSPRLSPNGNYLAFLRNPVGGPHVRSAQLCVFDVLKEETRVVIDYVDTSIKDSNGATFYGLYSASDLAKNCWCSDSKRIFISTYNYYASTIILVDTETFSFSLIPSDCSQRVLDVKEDFALISRSSLLKPTQLLIGSVPPALPSEIELFPLNNDREIGIKSVDICLRLCENVPHPNPDVDLPVPYMYLGPTNDNDKKKKPVIVLLHGGPHSIALNSFSNGVLFYLKLGYSFIIPNYRGSLGQGRKSIESLPGHCGSADISDAHACIKHCLVEFSGFIDEGHINLLGGSHGGFMVTHIAAQFPDLAHRIVSRNPVTEMFSLQLTGDIPDWAFTESGIAYEFGKVTDAKQGAKMFNMSPLSLVDNVKTPIMLQLGKKDRRVPYMQGLLYHKRLLARGVKTEAFLYDDCHPLSKVDVEADCLIHSARWFASED